MVATVMRTTSLKVQNQLPNADQVEKLEKKDLVMYIHVGKPNEEFSKSLEMKQGFN